MRCFIFIFIVTIYYVFTVIICNCKEFYGSRWISILRYIMQDGRPEKFVARLIDKGQSRLYAARNTTLNTSEWM